MSTERRKEEKGSKLGLILLVVIAVAVGAFILLNTSSTSTYTSEVSSAIDQIVPEEPKDPYDDIRNREYIKRQQELIVLETFLNEERARVEKEKADAIAKFDSEIAGLETKLEEVRGEKMSFQ